MDSLLKRRKGYIMLAVCLMCFVFLLLAGDFLLFTVENQVNDRINSLDDSFRAIETIYKVSGHNSVYPVTVTGRIICWLILIISIVILVVFAAQIFAIFNTINFKREVKKIRKEIDEDQLEVLTEMEETQQLDKKIMRQQQDILEYEEDIMKKLDDLRKQKK